jgi:hypothetical protein
MQFQRNISLLLGRMDPHQRVEFYLGRRGLHTSESFAPTMANWVDGHKMCMGGLRPVCHELHAGELETWPQ